MTSSIRTHTDEQRRRKTRAPRKHYRLCAHLPGSDYYCDRDHPSFTMWPGGSILSGISRAEARVIERALNAAVVAGELVS